MSMRTMPRKTAQVLGLFRREPAHMTREQAMEYLGGRVLLDDACRAGWLTPCARKPAARSQSGRGRGDTLFFATTDVYRVSERIAQHEYPMPIKKGVTQ